MIIAETFESVYKINLDWVPRNIYNGMGSFNVFKTALSNTKTPFTFKHRNYYRITLLKGHCRIFMSDEVIEVTNQALLLSNPEGAYTIKPSKDAVLTYYCIFSSQFLQKAEDKNFSELFQPNGVSVCNLSDEQVKSLSGIFELMLEEISSNYLYKYDTARILVSEMLHLRMRIGGV